MSIPVTSDDINNGVFTDVAKYLGRHWPVGKSLSLSKSQDALAVCMGYRDFHDVQQSAKLISSSESVDLENARAIIRERMVSEFGLAKDLAAKLSVMLPLLKMSFSKNRPSVVRNPVTEHKSWKSLLRAIEKTSAKRWLTGINQSTAMVIMQPAVAVARAITVWAPDLLERQHLRVHLVGASEVEATGSGTAFNLLPTLLGCPGMTVEVVMVGLEVDQGRMPESVIYPGPAMRVVKKRFGTYLYDREYSKPDITVFANPGLSNEYHSWLSEDDGMLDYLAKNRAIFIGYMFDDCELDGEILRAHGVTSGNVDVNPFLITKLIDGHEIQYTYGMASFLTEPGVVPLRDKEQLEILERAEWLASMPFDGIGPKEFKDHFAKIQSIGEVRTIDLVDGTKVEIVDLGRGFMADLKTGGVAHRVSKNQMPQQLPFLLGANYMAEYPGKEARWIRRATWVAGVWIDYIHKFEKQHPFFTTMGSEDYQNSAGHFIETFASYMGLDTDSDDFNAIRKALAPAPPKAIAEHHQALFKALNGARFDLAYEMLEKDPSLVQAVDQDSKTALFYAAHQGDERLAIQFLDLGGDAHQQDREGWTALMDAARENHSCLFPIFSDYGVNLECGNPLGWTPLLIALSSGAKETAIQLVKCGANYEAKTPMGETAYELAVQLGFQDDIDAAIRTSRNARF